MKKGLSIFLVLLMVISMSVSIFASETDFVPSITEKHAPELVKDENGNVGVIKDAEGNVIAYVPEACLVITSVFECYAEDENATAAMKAVISLYEKLVSGEMKLPAEKLDENLSHDELTVRDLFDLSWQCTHEEPHDEMVIPEGTVLEVTFNLKAATDVELFAMTYKNDEFNPIAYVKNNGDGTFTCGFEHLCPVAFIYGNDQDNPTDGDAFGAELMLWTSVMAVSTVALVAVVAFSRKKRA